MCSTDDKKLGRQQSEMQLRDGALALSRRQRAALDSRDPSQRERCNANDGSSIAAASIRRLPL